MRTTTPAAPGTGRPRAIGLPAPTTASPTPTGATASGRARVRRRRPFGILLGLLLIGAPASPRAQDFLTNGLVAYYPFDGDARDASGNSRHGTVSGATLASDRFERPSSAFSFADIGDHITVSDSLHPQGEVTLTYSCWIREPESFTVFNRQILGCGTPGIANTRSGLATAYRPLANMIYIGQFNDAGTPDTFLELNQWHHLVLTKYATKVAFFADGQLVSQGQTEPGQNVTSHQLNIGWNGHAGWGDGEQYFGLIDDIRIYDRVLGEREILSLYDYESNWSLSNSPPAILTQPVVQSVYAGEPVSLSVFARGTWPLSYQWQREGRDVAGATNATLAFAAATLADAGEYAVVVTNGFGSVTSTVARLNVSGRPWPYVADFEGAVGNEWSQRQTEVTPMGSRQFLGQFGNETVTLSLGGLPPHRAVTVSLDLFVIHSWDGNDTTELLWPIMAGPDIWDLSVQGGPNLLHTTFLQGRTDTAQAFPHSYPSSNHPGRTGAAENNSLGFIWGDGTVLDSVYQLTFTFPHSTDTVALSFSAQNLEDLSNESWGLDNVRIDLTPAEDVTHVRTQLVQVGGAAPPAPGSAARIAASGTLALVADGGTSISLVDLGDPRQPVWLGTAGSLFQPAALALSGRLAFVASFEPDLLSTIEVFDFSDPAKPVLRGYYDTEGYARDLALVDGMLYVADDLAGLAIVDATNPAHLRRVGGYDTQGRVTQVEVTDQRACLTDGDWLLILDVTDPAFPVRIGLHDLGAPIQTLRVLGPTAAVLLATGEVRLLDVSDPARVRPLGVYRTWGVQSLALSGRHAFLAKGSRGIEIVDISDASRPAWVTGVVTGARAEDVAATGSGWVVAGGEAGVVNYALEQAIHPPLAPPVIADGVVTLSWPAMEGVRLERTPSIVPAQWLEVPGSALTNTVHLPVTGAAGFFRLNQPTVFSR